MIICGAGLPTALPGLVKDKRVKIVPIVSSARAAGLIIKSWMKKYNRVPDAILFEGPMPAAIWVSRKSR
jgi:NAD(P)H-dependent flavin oxidoreductase YrpB (nitropropane dioxygenase family)